VPRYLYRCDACKARSGAGSRQAIESVRDDHRRIAHHGLTPDGESMSRASGNTAPVTRAQLVVVGLVVLWLLFAACDRLTS